MKTKLGFSIIIIIGVVISIIIGKMFYHFLYEQPTNELKVGDITYKITLLDKTTYSNKTEYKVVFKNIPEQIEAKLSFWVTGKQSYVEDGVITVIDGNTLILTIPSNLYPEGNVSVVYFIKDATTGEVRSFEINDREFK